MRRPAERLGLGIGVALALAAAATPAGAGEPMTLTLDPRRTTIRWVLSGFPDTVHGTFQLTSGTLGFDTRSGTADGCLRVETGSGESGNASRDRKMHEQILESPRFPLALLRPLRLEGVLPAAGESTLRLQGLLALHGAWHAVTLPARLTRTGETVVADATLTIPYVAWGLTDPSVLIFRAGKTVDLDLHAVGVVTAGAPAAPAVCEP